MEEVKSTLQVSEPMSPFATRAKRTWADAVALGWATFVGGQQLHGKHMTQQERREED